MKLRVCCTFVIEVDAPDWPDYDPHFAIEENGCPGTGIVGAALDRHMRDCDERSVCWACTLDGKNEILPEDPT